MQDFLGSRSAAGSSAGSPMAATERGLDASLELIRLERLRDEVVGTQLEPEHDVRRPAMFAQDDDRGAGPRLQSCHQDQAVDIRKRAIDNEQVWSDNLSQCLAFGAGGGLKDLEASRPQGTADELGDLLVGFDDQDGTPGGLGMRSPHKRTGTLSKIACVGRQPPRHRPSGCELTATRRSNPPP